MQIHILTVIKETPYEHHVVCRKSDKVSLAIYTDRGHAQNRLEYLSSRPFRQPKEYQIITVDVDDTQLREKHRRATKHIQQLVTHPVTSEITGKLHMRLRGAETALRWSQTHLRDLSRRNDNLSKSYQWALAALAASWIVFASVLGGAFL